MDFSNLVPPMRADDIAADPNVADRRHGRLVAGRIFSLLLRHGYRGYSGVPCSWLKHFFALLEDQSLGSDVLYVPAVREDSAMAVAAGLHLAGIKSCVLMQNSGLGNALNVLTSLSLIYRIPAFLIISWRGGTGTDAVEHDVMGANLIALLDALGLRHHVLDLEKPESAVLSCLTDIDETGSPSALLVSREF